MADDLDNDWKDDRLSYMSHLRTQFRDEGTFFKNHIAAQPVCGPSRSSLLLGRWPHNVGYVVNDDLDSIEAFVSQHNNSVGKWLSDAGYYTAFHGKYVNACEHHLPSGWSHYGGFTHTYNFYNASCWAVEAGDATPPAETIKVMTGIHQADFLGNFTLKSARRALAQAKPFFIHVTPVMPHWGTCDGPAFPPGEGYAPTDPHWEFDLVDGAGEHWMMPISPCPTKRHAHAFDGQRNRHVQGLWNISITGARPKHMLHTVEVEGRLTAFQAEREDIGWRNRSCALLDLDHLLGVIVDGLDALGMLQTTFALFTSDNGYHLGEHKLPFGKGLPYETDVRLPFYIRGPGVHRNTTLPHLTNHLDITATVVEIAQAGTFAPQLDGKSFLNEILAAKSVGDLAVEGSAGTPSFAARAEAWRQFSFSEFFGGEVTWRLVRVVNSSHALTYAHWCTNDTEVFDLDTDPYQMANLAGAGGASGEFAARVVATLAPLAVTLGGCKGEQCSMPVPATSPPYQECTQIIQAKDANVGSWSLLPHKGSGKRVTGLHGWAVDFRQRGGPQNVRGWTAVTVRVLIDGKRARATFPDLTANVSRPNIVKGQIPNAEHGFVYTVPDGFFGPAKHTIQLRALDASGAPHFLTRTGAPTEPQCVCNGVECAC